MIRTCRPTKICGTGWTTPCPASFGWKTQPVPSWTPTTSCWDISPFVSRTMEGKRPEGRQKKTWDPVIPWNPRYALTVHHLTLSHAWIFWLYSVFSSILARGWFPRNVKDPSTPTEFCVPWLVSRLGFDCWEQPDLRWTMPSSWRISMRWQTMETICPFHAIRAPLRKPEEPKLIRSSLPIGSSMAANEKNRMIHDDPQNHGLP